MYKVSVICPLYNSEKHVDKLMDCFINQTIFEDVEFILVDDCSSDSTKDKLKDYNGYENIKTIFLDENHGFPGFARNVGMDNASADYIMFIDHDDSYAFDFCEVMYNTIVNCREDMHVDVVTTDYIILEKDCKLKTNLYPGKIKNTLINSKSIINNFKDATIWNKIFKKDILNKYSIRFITDGLDEDYLFLLYFYYYSNNILFLKDYYGYKWNRQIDTTSTPTVKSVLNFIESYYLTFKVHKELGIDISSFKGRIYTSIERIALICNIKDMKFLLKELYDFEKYIDFNGSLDGSWQNILNKLILRKHFTFVSICLYIIGKIRLNNYLWRLIAVIYHRKTLIKS